MASAQQVRVSVAGVPSVGFALPQSVAWMEESTQGDGDHPEPERLARHMRRSRRGPKTRRDTMELSRVPRLAARLRAPMHANSAVSFLQKLARARTDGGLQAQPAQGLCMPAEGNGTQEALLDGQQHVMQPEKAGSAVEVGDGADAEMDKAKAIILAAVQRRKLGKAGAAKTGADGATQSGASTATGSATAEVDASKSDAVDWHQHDGLGVSAAEMGDSIAEEQLCSVPEEPAETVATAPDEHVREEHNAAPGNQARRSRSITMRMPDVHATSIAVANALRSIGSARARDQTTSRPPLAWSSSLRSRSPSHSPPRGPAQKCAQGNTTMKPWLVSARLGQGRTPPTRSRSLSPRHVPSETQVTGRRRDTVIAELQAQTHTMASIMNEHMPWMINEVLLPLFSSNCCC